MPEPLCYYCPPSPGSSSSQSQSSWAASRGRWQKGEARDRSRSMEHPVCPTPSLLSEGGLPSSSGPAQCPGPAPQVLTHWPWPWEGPLDDALRRPLPCVPGGHGGSKCQRSNRAPGAPCSAPRRWGWRAWDLTLRRRLPSAEHLTQSWQDPGSAHLRTAVDFLPAEAGVHGLLKRLCGQLHCVLDSLKHLPLARICGLT